jgi:hypothetical protein
VKSSRDMLAKSWKWMSLKGLWWLVLFLVVGLVLGFVMIKAPKSLPDVSGKYQGTITRTRIETVEEEGWLGHTAKISFLVIQEGRTLTLQQIYEKDDEETSQEKPLEEQEDAAEEEIAVVMDETFTGMYEPKTGEFTYQYDEDTVWTLQFEEVDQQLRATGSILFQDREKGLQDEMDLMLIKALE